MREKKQAPVEMTEEERLQHEKYVRELTEKNKKTVRKLCTVLWCIAMAGWAIFLVLDVVFAAGGAKLLFHGMGAVLTALLALPRVMDFFAAKRNKSEDVEA